MSRLYKFTREQKIKLSKLGKNPDDYLLVSRSKNSLVIQHRETGKQELVELSYPKRAWMR